MFQFQQQDFDPQSLLSGSSVPPGIYDVAIESGQVKANSAGDGAYYEMKMRVLSGPSAGQYIFDRLNIKNSNAQAVEIAHKTAARYCAVTLGPRPGFDPIEATGVPFKVEVAPQPNNPQYTQVKQIMDKFGNLPGKSGSAPGQAAPSVPAPAAPPAQPAPATGGWAGQPPQAAPAQPQTAPPAAWGGMTAPPAQPAQPQAPAQPAQGGWGQPPAPAAAPAPAAPVAWGAQPR